MILETERLILREFTLDDTAEYFRLISNPEVMRFSGNPPEQSIEEASQTLMQGPLQHYRVHGFGRWACIEKQNNELIGFNGCKYNDILNVTEIGYAFLPEYWGLGLATESSLAVMQYCHEVIDLKDIVAIVMPEHSASIAVLKKIGLQYDRMEVECGVEVAIYV